jgi:hypothetical protein
VVLAFVAVRYWLPGPELTLAYLKVLVWPTLAFALLFALRDRLLEKLSEMVEWAGFGQLFKFRNEAGSAVSARASQALGGGAIWVNGAWGPAPGSSVPEPSEGPAEAAKDETSLEEVQREFERVRRQSVESFFTQGAVWGWDMAQLGFKSRPIPVFEWSDDGRPTVRYDLGQSGRSSRDRAIRVLESELTGRHMRSAQAQNALAMALARERAAGPGDSARSAQSAVQAAQMAADVAQRDVIEAEHRLREVQTLS